MLRSNEAFSLGKRLLYCLHHGLLPNEKRPACWPATLNKLSLTPRSPFGPPQLQPNSASGSGALEHDPSSIYLRVPVGEVIPGPLPLGVSVIDASVALFGVVFPHVSFKHR